MNFFELDISYFQRAQQLTFQEILILGIFHGIVFSLPFSAPLLICFRRFLLDGLKVGFSALLGTVFGQLTFLLFIFLGFRPLIQCWYIFEPFLAFVGMSLTLKLATDFFHQRNFGFETGRVGSLSAALPNQLNGLNGLKAFLTSLFTRLDAFPTSGKIFFFQFLLMFLNPAFPATISRFILSQELFDGLPVASASLSPFSFAMSYGFGFIVGSIVFVSLFITIFKLVSNQLENFSAIRSRALGNPFFLNKAFVFLIIGCLLQGTIQYSWRLFTQYPLEFVTNVVAAPVGQREFPSFDSNIRHRDKNLPVDRHIPVEKVNARRTLSGRPPLNEEQKSDAYLKYNSFFLNKLEHAIEDSKIQFKTGTGSPDLHIRTYQDIVQLQKMKERYLSGTSGANATSKARPLENNTKGKPKFSYIRELLDGSNTNGYLHDDIQIYNALFKVLGH